MLLIILTWYVSPVGRRKLIYKYIPTTVHYMVAMWKWRPKQTSGITVSQTYSLAGVSMKESKLQECAKKQQRQQNHLSVTWAINCP